MRTHRILLITALAALLIADAHFILAAEATPDTAKTDAAKSEGKKSEKEYPVEVFVETTPLQYAFVTGDDAKFQAHQWMKTGYSGGVEEYQIRYLGPEGVSAYMEGQAVMGDNDYEGELLLKKEDFGFIEFDYKQFRKYFDTTGGVYRWFNRLSVNELDNKELILTIGHFGIEAGLTVPDRPEIVLFYEHEYKDGEKSRLTWASATEGAIARKIVPSWQEIDESGDIFGIRASHDIDGVLVKGEHKWELVHSNNRRYELQRSTNVTASERKIRIQDQAPKSKLMTSLIELEKWAWKEKVYGSAAYRYSRLTSEENEELREFDEFLNPRSFANAENKFGNVADNSMDTNILVFNFMARPKNWLTSIVKLKGEVIRKGGNSHYPAYTTDPPPGVPVRDDASVVSGRQWKSGESISLRYKGIPRTALYTDLQFEQIRNLLNEDRESVGPTSSAAEVFQRETITFMPRTVWDIGGNFSPVQIVNFTSQFRLRSDRNDYDDVYETFAATAARSAFIDELNLFSTQYSQRVTIRPCPFFQTSFRYLFDDTDINTRVENFTFEETEYKSHMYIFEATVTPVPEFSLTGSFSRRSAIVDTPAALGSSTGDNYPVFNVDSNTWMFNGNYQATENVSLGSTFSYTYARNFNSEFFYVNRTQYYGPDFDKLGLTVYADCRLKKGFSVKPKYSFYHYGANEDVEISHYNAHLIGVDVITEWG